MSEPKTIRVTEEDRERALRVLTDLHPALVAAKKSPDSRMLPVDVIALALATARAEGAEERWIPVGERMPERGEWVLLWVADPEVREVQMGQHDGESEWWAFSRPYEGEAGGRKISVTHWMPLPSEPAAERKA